MGRKNKIIWNELNLNLVFNNCYSSNTAISDILIFKTHYLWVHIETIFHLAENPLTKSIVSVFLTYHFTLHKSQGSSQYPFIAHILTSFGQTTLVKYGAISTHVGLYVAEHKEIKKKKKTMLSDFPPYSCFLVSNEFCSARQLYFLVHALCHSPPVINTLFCLWLF